MHQVGEHCHSEEKIVGFDGPRKACVRGFNSCGRGIDGGFRDFKENGGGGAHEVGYCRQTRLEKSDRFLYVLEDIE